MAGIFNVSNHESLLQLVLKSVMIDRGQNISQGREVTFQPGPRGHISAGAGRPHFSRGGGTIFGRDRGEYLWSGPGIWYC